MELRAIEALEPCMWNGKSVKLKYATISFTRGRHMMMQQTFSIEFWLYNYW